MSFEHRLAVALGGVAGATVRWGFQDIAGSGPDGWPWSLVVINVVGSLVLGAALAGPAGRHELARLVVGVGFCGGLTTFSSFAVDAAAMLDRGAPGDAAAFVAVSVAASCAAVVAGVRLGSAVSTR